MNKIVNEYALDKNDFFTSTLTIKSVIYNDITITFDTILKDYLVEFRWCFERSKGLVYAYDNENVLPIKLFKHATPKLYLHKLIYFIATKKVTGDWKRKSKLDYKLYELYADANFNISTNIIPELVLDSKNTPV